MWKRILETCAQKNKRMSFNTIVQKVDPSAIHFTSTAHLDGTLPHFTDPATEAALKEAAALIRDTDNTVAFPTETVYGLGGSSLNDNAVRNIYAAKNRPSDNPLITHVASIDQLNRRIYQDLSLPEGQLYKHIPKIYLPLLDKLWPGPLTILLPVPSSEKNTLSKLTTADEPTFAVRIPANPVARALIALSDTPIAAPSANASTRPSPTLASHVYHDLQGKIPLILDGGPSNVGVESTVVDGLCSPPMLLRPGGFTYEQIVQIGGDGWLDCKVETKTTLHKGEKVRTPGMKYKHYSPSAKVILLVPGERNLTIEEKMTNLKSIIQNEAKLNSKLSKVAILTTLCLQQLPLQDLFQRTNIQAPIVQHLGETGEEIQKNLFASLRDVDELQHVDLILVEGIPEQDEGLAVMNRLKKASAGNHIFF